MARYFVLYMLPVLALVGFLNVAFEVGEGETLSYDEKILLGIYEKHTPFLDAVMRFFTELGGPLLLPVVVTALGIFLLTRHKTWQGLLLGIGVGGAAVINIILKLIYQRERPQLWEQIIVEHSPSFPSGHAMASSALVVAIIFIVWRTKYRIVLSALAICFAVLVSYSRLYFGVHYPTDILAGWLVSTGWVIGVYAILRKTYLNHSQNKSR